jgi:hypothetical protein
MGMTMSSPSNPLVAVERTGLAIAVVAVAVSGLLWGGRGLLAAAAGACLACVNLWILRRLVGRALHEAETGGGQGAGRRLAFSLVLKMPLLFALVWVAVGVLKLELLPFALGLSVLVFALVTAGLFTGLKEAA